MPRRAPLYPGEGREAPEPRTSAAGRSRPPRRPRAPRGELGRRRRVFFAFGAIVAVAVLWFLISLFQPFAGSGGAGVQVTVPRGASVSTIADELAKRGVISSAFFFEARATIGGDRGNLKSGDYTLRKDMSYSDAIAALVTGPSLAVVNVTIPEGRSRAEIAAALTPEHKLAGDYLTATKTSSLLDPRSYGAKAPQNLEGFLFPNTYQLKRGASVDVLVGKQLTAFKGQFAGIDLRAAHATGLSPYDVVLIASLIEREAAAAAERPVIASVIYNRLRQGIPLGIDATTRFITGNWTQPLTQTQLAVQSPYNTRIHAGLPPGPIGNPGLSSLRAAAQPAATSYLYYVANPCKPGTHSFSTSSTQFNADVQRYYQARQRAGGRAPTGC